MHVGANAGTADREPQHAVLVGELPRLAVDDDAARDERGPQRGHRRLDVVAALPALQLEHPAAALALARDDALATLAEGPRRRPSAGNDDQRESRSRVVCSVERLHVRREQRQDPSLADQERNLVDRGRDRHGPVAVQKARSAKGDGP
ncbi:MAG: hypothetical protein AVDCRST_MAG85-3344 [uncultured Solirubrobacteraceae bacterium]|uniref:Uncharacterized protein n=1 Tax=uncultured Solirubrobacteraceae bacterium TaxID=1162706 RepID=A0A6J4TLS5_9ACTN|nr:MAG: hypothetical protein AVDCRST_MAG85-3344 [uncultured Solirubrobacteraceae bacterium]